MSTDPRLEGEIDQALKHVVDGTARFVRALYQELRDKGFDEVQSLDLCKVCLANSWVVRGGIGNA